MLRAAVAFAPILALVALVLVTLGPATANPLASVRTGADELVSTGFAALKGKRVGLITNQTGRVGGEHLADLLAKAPGAKLAAILAPEHGFRGAVEAGAKVSDGVDARTGAPVLSLYGSTKKPTREMLRNLDVLVFDIQDIGARFYTYISTMGLAMQAAAEMRIPFIVLDRPNPLGGEDVAGFVLEPGLKSFVGQYPVPIVHGLTVGELAWMIKGERWLDGLETLDLSVMKMKGWQRAMRWPETGLAWVATSPNIPTFESALAYPGIGVVGELDVSEGRGTPTPFTLVGAPWLDAQRAAEKLSALGLAGARFEATSYTPQSVKGAAANPRFMGQRIAGVRVVIADPKSYRPLETGMHVLGEVVAQARAKSVSGLVGNPGMLNAIAGTRRLQQMVAQGASGAAIIAAWQQEVAQFKARRAKYLLY